MLHLDPGIPFVWRSPNDLQVGAARPYAVIADASHAQLRMLDALRVGVSREVLTRIARDLGDDDSSVDVLLAQLEPALRSGRAEDVRSTPETNPREPIALSGGGDLARAIAAHLHELGHRVVHAEGPDASSAVAAVLIGDHVFDPGRHTRWMHTDTPHLPVLTDDAGVHIGPFVEPGLGPCLACLASERRRADPAWPAIASQLLGREPLQVSARVLIATAAGVACAVYDRVRRNDLSRMTTEILFDRLTGSATRVEHPLSERCACRSPGGNVRVLGDRADTPTAPSSSARDGAAHA